MFRFGNDLIIERFIIPFLGIGKSFLGKFFLELNIIEFSLEYKAFILTDGFFVKEVLNLRNDNIFGLFFLERVDI